MRPADLNVTMKISQSSTKLPSNHIMRTTEPFKLKYFKRPWTTKTSDLTSAAKTNSGKTALLKVERSNGTLCATARSMLNHTISKWNKTITAELSAIYNTIKRRSRDYDINPWEQFRGERSKLDQNDMHRFFSVYILDRRMQEGTSCPMHLVTIK
jgi:hypothetical protein